MAYRSAGRELMNQKYSAAERLCPVNEYVKRQDRTGGGREIAKALIPALISRSVRIYLNEERYQLNPG